MNNNIFADNDDPAFFGKVNAVISHEIKNIMAIISETAGLMEDLSEMAKKGDRLDAEYINNCCKDIVEEIQRGFTTVKAMNQFSHNYDHVIKEVNVGEILRLSCALTGFLSYASEISFDPLSEKNAVVSTCPYRLLHLFYIILESAYKSVGSKGKAEVGVKLEDGSAVVVNITASGGDKKDIIETDEMKKIAGSINVDVHIDPVAGKYTLLVPEAIQ